MIQHDLSCDTIDRGGDCTCQKTLSRAFLCVECEEPIHEAPGESNHIMVENIVDGEVIASHGPFHEDCSEVWMKEHPP